jgi:hypothetical protein
LKVVGVQATIMAVDGDADTSRVTVKTYVPAYQKDEWKSHAEDLGMSQSEFVKTMVQAGHRGFLDAESSSTDDPEEQEEGAEGDGLKEHVVDVLDSDDHLDWEAVLDAVTDDIEGRLEDVLAELQDDNVVRYSGRHGRYTLVEQ